MEQNFEKNTPLMQQYLDIKAQFPDTLVLFQVGDFYELFFDDAKIASAHLAIALTKRGKNKGEDVPLCGIPVHALNHYLVKLIKGGFRVALCEQLAKPQPGTVVERGVTQVFTPATLTQPTMLDEKAASYLLVFYPSETHWGLLFSELMTAQLFATIIPAQHERMVESELIRFLPDEIILPQLAHSTWMAPFFKRLGYPVSSMAPIESDTELSSWTNAFSPKAQGTLAQHPLIINNLQLFYSFLKRTNHQALAHFTSLNFYQPGDYLILDAATQKNLELITNKNDSSAHKTLFSVLDRAQTSMGSRTIKKWIQRPLVQKNLIEQRHEFIAALRNNIELLHTMTSLLGQLADLERIVGRIALERAQLYDYLALKRALEIVPLIKQLLVERMSQTSLASILQERIADFTALVQLLSCALTDDPASAHPIKRGYDQTLDQLRDILDGGQANILKLEQEECARTGISSLKIGYNHVSGYYIEVTNPNLDKVPTHYRHQQTLANRKRFVTDELEAYERNLVRAQHDVDQVEQGVFDHIKQEICAYVHHLRAGAHSLAYLDALVGFATAAYEYRYVMPTFVDHQKLLIINGRHPVVEQTSNATFVPNNTTLTAEEPTWIITGPNMGGKSTYLRQVALISIMAQCGSFVPAQSAELAIIDRIFTRIGSGDNLAEGKSTFLVEMEETATICTQATKHSLVILDEVGRGTSTYDGMALAQAIIEHIHHHIGALCLFATHYHELTHLAETTTGIMNYHAASKRVGDSVIFMHKILPGNAEGSFGLDVARLAQLPTSIIQRASAILAEFQPTHAPTQPIQRHTNTEQLVATIHTLEEKLATYHTIAQRIERLDCTTLTPKQAFDLLWDLTHRDDLP
ncbi:MAG: DNA mismatch repair protein MutS [Candidatus Babeliales bacterium]|jgi:DNA mismatch repair protein MutS